MLTQASTVSYYKYSPQADPTADMPFVRQIIPITRGAVVQAAAGQIETYGHVAITLSRNVNLHEQACLFVASFEMPNIPPGFSDEKYLHLQTYIPAPPQNQFIDEVIERINGQGLFLTRELTDQKDGELVLKLSLKK